MLALNLIEGLLYMGFQDVALFYGLYYLDQDQLWLTHTSDR